jgi:glutamate-1-semialdehyde 2,1-aminomutase
MVTASPVRIDPARIAELTEYEQKKLDASTPKSGEMYEWARRSLAGGVSSSYQLRDPWPIYLTEGKGSKVWDVDGTERIDFHNGFGSMVQGHANPYIVEAVQKQVARGTHFAAPV